MRRLITLLLAAFILSLCSMTPLTSAPAPESAWDFDALPVHPRLFTTSSEWRDLKARLTTDPVSARLFNCIQTDADALLDQPPVALIKEGRRLLGPVRIAQGRIVQLALVARLTGDKRYTQRAIVEMRHLAEAPNWNPNHFLDVAEAALALGTGYDWLYDQLSPEERTVIADAIINKALLPSLKESNGKPLWWVRGNNNWNQVCHGGLTVAALAIADKNPALARRIVDRAVANLHYSAEAYAPDGAYPEGPTYWGYGTTFQVVLIEALRTALGTTANLDAFPGFLKSADYMQQVTTPAGKFYAYSDGTDRRPFTPALFWFARHIQRADLINNDLTQLQVSTTGVSHSRFSPFALIWRDPSLPTAKTTASLSWFAGGKNPLGIHRSAWNDPHAVYLAIKGGSPSVNHGHMDVGSFLIEADGITWAVDIGSQDYHSLESAGVKGLFDNQQKSARWDVFRLGAESHNIIRFDEQSQVAKATAKLGRHRATGEAPFTQFDLSPLYAGQVAAVQRGASLLADRRIVVQDEWTALPDKAVAVSWQWLTRADVTVSGTTVTLRHDGQHLRFIVREPAGARIEIEDVSAPREPYDAPNPGLKRIRIHTHTEAGQAGRINILVTPGSVSDQLAPPALRPLADW